MRDDFAIFITSYNNPNNITTLDSLNRAGYDGDWYVVVDDNDPQIEKYKENIPKEHLLLYNKKEQEKYYDSCDNFHKLNSHINSLSIISYFAKKLNYNYYYNAEDDYDGFYYIKKENDKYIYKDVFNINDIFNIYIDFLNCNNNIMFLSFSSLKNVNGVSRIDFFNVKKRFGYFNYNGWICDVNKEFDFISTIGNDTLTCYNIYRKGLLSFSINYIGNLHIYYFNFNNSEEYKKSKNSGNSNLYKEMDYEITKLYNLMVEPSISNLFYKNNKLHLKKFINNIVPKIIDERWKK